MPQVGGHLVVADKIRDRLDITDHIDQNLNEYSLGALGPDLTLFLFDPIGESATLNAAVDTYEVIHEVSSTISEISNKVTGPAEDFADWVTGGLSTSLFSLIGRSFKALESCAATAVVPGRSVSVDNPFAGLNVPGVPNGASITVQSSDLSDAIRRFGHPWTSDPGYKVAETPGDYTNWWWVDLLHYRRTGPFAAELMQSAGSNAALKSFATGYWTHIAADVCGHPYVNGVVGGPYRNHVMRHMVLENIMDTWLWKHFTGRDITGAKLHERVTVDDFSPIARHLIAAMEKMFTKPPVGRMPMRPEHYRNSLPSEADLDRAYKLMLNFLELSTDSLITAPVPPPSSPQEFFEEIGDSIANTANSVTEQFSSSNEWWEWLLAPFLAALYGLVLVFKLLTLPAAVLTRAISLAPRWYAYMLEMALYNFIREARWSLALTGWGRPSNEDLMRPIATTSYFMPPQRTGTSAFEYPMAATSHNQFAFWLRDPALAGASQEQPGAECCPYPKMSTPDIFVTGAGYYSSQDTLLKRMGGSLPSPSSTVDLEWQTFGGSQFGNAVDFGVKLIDGSYPIASFDLDGDRGYGYQSWAGPATVPTYDPSLVA